MLPRRFGFLLLLVFAATAGCAASDSASDEAGSSIPNNTGGGGPTSSTATSIAFCKKLDCASTVSDIQYIPGERNPLTVLVAPPGAHQVRFSLLGESLDAYFDAGDLTTGEDGHATVVFGAPSTQATFRVRASVGNVSTELSATPVEATTSVDVVPKYEGSRTVTSWIGTVRTGADCSALPGQPPFDGAILEEAPPGAKIGLKVPAGIPITIIVRAGYFAWGCVKLDDGVEGGEGAITSITVPVTDRPLQMAGVRVPVTLGVDATPDLVSAWGALGGRMAAAFAGDAKDDAVALLDAMAEATPVADRTAFQAVRETGAAEVLSILVRRSGDGTGLRGAALRWAESGLGRLTEGGISGLITSLAVDGGKAHFEVRDVAGLVPGEAGFWEDPSEMSWLTEPGDSVLFGGTAAFRPSSFAAALAIAGAETEFPGSGTVPDALAAEIDCTAIGAALVYARCNAGCAAKRCEDALVSMWTRARDLETDPKAIEITASGVAMRIDDDARPLLLDGTWVGTLALGVRPVAVNGPVEGSDPLAAPP